MVSPPASCKSVDSTDNAASGRGGSSVFQDDTVSEVQHTSNLFSTFSFSKVLTKYKRGTGLAFLGLQPRRSCNHL